MEGQLIFIHRIEFCYKEYIILCYVRFVFKIQKRNKIKKSLQFFLYFDFFHEFNKDERY